MTMTDLRRDIICVNCPEMAPPAGHYSHVCVAGGMVYVSGQLPLCATGVPLTDQSFERQARQALDNVDRCLATAGVNRSRLVQVRVYITDMARWPEFNGIYAQWIGDHRPSRAVAPVPTLHYGVSIEIEAVALAPTVDGAQP